MSEQTTEEKCIVISEGQIAWIMERDTPEERLAAWEVFAAIACPDEGTQYEPPKQTRNGVKLSKLDRVKRDAYNVFRGIQRVTMPGITRMRFQSGESSVSGESTATNPISPNYTMDEPTFGRSNGRRGSRIDYSKLTPEDKAAIANWDKQIPDPKALKEYLDKNYLYQNRLFVQTDEFCAYAFNLLKGQRWISTRTGKPLVSLVTAIFYIALDYKQKNDKIKRIEMVEHAKDVKTEFEVLTTEQEMQTPSDLAAIERKRRRIAEKELEEKYLKGLSQCGNQKK